MKWISIRTHISKHNGPAYTSLSSKALSLSLSPASVIFPDNRKPTFRGGVLTLDSSSKRGTLRVVSDREHFPTPDDGGGVSMDEVRVRRLGEEKAFNLARAAHRGCGVEGKE